MQADQLILLPSSLQLWNSGLQKTTKFLGHGRKQFRMYALWRLAVPRC